MKQSAFLALGVVVLWSTSSASARRTRTVTSSTTTTQPWQTITSYAQSQHPGWFPRRPDNGEISSSADPEEDKNDDKHSPISSSHNNNNNGDDDDDNRVSNADDLDDDNEESISVGVKSHSKKKSNAVGDPDGEGSDDDDSDLSDAEPISWEEEVMEVNSATTVAVDIDLELLKDDTNDSAAADVADVEDEPESGSDEEMSTSVTSRSAKGLSSVSVRLGRLANRRSKKHKKADDKQADKALTNEKEQAMEATMQAWQPFVFFPPSASALDHLSEHARELDTAAKIRLDRRTLYAGLMLEWLPHLLSKSSHRKYLDATTSQTLQAALSMACQPQWRKTWPRHNGIRLYNAEATDAKACTLAMQETIAMALVSVYCA
jgi:hypothetical protein